MQIAPFTVHVLFFTGATAYSAVSVLVWAFLRWPRGETAFWHAHEMIYGYAVAVIAGFLLTRTSTRTAVLAFSFWAAARLAWLFPMADMALPAHLLSVAASTIILSLAGGGFLQGVKRHQNASFPVILIILGMGDPLSLGGGLLDDDAMTRSGIWLGLFATVALISTMGGRIAGAALSGLAQRAGGRRIVPSLRLERGIIFALAATAAALALNLGAIAVAVCSGPAGGALLWRVYGWRRGLGLAGADLRALCAAQVFIASGLIGIGLTGVAPSWVAPSWPMTAPLHLVTIGGIGMATTVMMLKATAQRDRTRLSGGTITGAAACIALAAILRAGGYSFPEAAYPLSAWLWVSAMAVCLAMLLVRPGADPADPA